MTKEIEHEILELLKPLDENSSLRLLGKIIGNISNNMQTDNVQEFIEKSKIKIQDILNTCKLYIESRHKGKTVDYDTSIRNIDHWLNFTNRLVNTYYDFYGVFDTRHPNTRLDEYDKFESIVDDKLIGFIHEEKIADELLAEFGIQKDLLNDKGLRAYYYLCTKIEGYVFDNQVTNHYSPYETIYYLLAPVSSALSDSKDTIDIILNNIKKPNSATKNALKEANSIQSGKLKGEEFSSSHELFKDVIYPARIEQRLK